MKHDSVFMRVNDNFKATIIVFIFLSICSCLFAKSGDEMDFLKIGLGEKLMFDIDVLFIDKVAVGSATLELMDKEKFIFQATVEAKIVRFFPENRNIYLSLMRYSPQEGKFKPMSFSETKYRRGRVYMNRTFYDSKKGIVVVEKWRDGALKKRVERVVKESEFYDDIVTAFYNMRIEAYGKIEEGKKFTVRSMHRDGKFYFSINVLSDKNKDWLSLKERNCLFGSSKYYVEVLTPKEVFDAQGGRLFIGFTEDLMPNFVYVRKVLGIGIIRGRLVDVKRSHDETSWESSDLMISKNPGNE